MRKHNNEKEKTNIIKQTKTQLIMKFKPFILGTMAMMAALFTACSSDEPVAGGGQDNSEDSLSENYVAISLELPAGAGTRADGDVFDDGTEQESTVSNVVFFFFNENDICVDVIKTTTVDFKKPETPSTNPAITKYGTTEIRLRSGLSYKKVAVVLNTDDSDATTLKSEVKTLTDLRNRAKDYVAFINEDGTGQVMSNSVYYDMKDASGNPVSSTKPTADKLAFPVLIDKDLHVYTSAQKPTIDALIAAGTKKYVDIFVERVVSKVNVTKAEFKMADYYIYEENNKKETTLTYYDHVNNSSRKITVQPVIKGMCLNVLTPETKLIKPLNLNEVGYQNGKTDYNAFQWNDPANKRSYWASTNLPDDDDMIYFSYNYAAGKGIEAFTQYIHPNTQDFEPTFDNEGNSLNTKVMVVAQLCEDGDASKPLSFVRYGADYMLDNNLLEYSAYRINTVLRNINWTTAGLKLGDADLTEEQLEAVKEVVNNTYLGTTEVPGITGGMLELVMASPEENNQPGDEDWMAKIVKSGSFTTGSLVAHEKFDAFKTTPLINAIMEKIDETVDSMLDDTLNTPDILYWKNGLTYFYHNIRHQGFNGLVGGGTDNFLYGVVRNHVYNVSLDGVYGLGTPVIEPGRPIDPDRPKDERPSYIKARINILPWRVVNNAATIH